MKPICYLRLRDGKPDWSEDCVSGDPQSLMGTYPPDEGYSVIPLYTFEAMPGWQMVPVTPTNRISEAGEAEILRQYRENPDWEEAKDVVECLDGAAIYTALLAAALRERVVEHPESSPARGV